MCVVILSSLRVGCNYYLNVAEQKPSSEDERVGRKRNAMQHHLRVQVLVLWLSRATLAATSLFYSKKIFIILFFFIAYLLQ